MRAPLHTVAEAKHRIRSPSPVRLSCKRGRVRVGVATILIALLLSATCVRGADPTPDANAPVTVKASVDRNQVTLGDPIRYTVEVAAATDTEILIPVYNGKLGEFMVSDFGELPTRQENGRTITSRWYTLSIFETGDHLIPAPQVQYRTPGRICVTPRVTRSWLA